MQFNLLALVRSHSGHLANAYSSFLEHSYSQIHMILWGLVGFLTTSFQVEVAKNIIIIKEALDSCCKHLRVDQNP